MKKETMICDFCGESSELFIGWYTIDIKRIGVENPSPSNACPKCGREITTAIRVEKQERKNDKTQPKWMPKNPYPKLKQIDYWETPRDETCQEANKDHQIFLDGCQQTARKLVEWLEDRCHHAVYRKFCPICWDELRKEAGL